MSMVSYCSLPSLIQEDVFTRLLLGLLTCQLLAFFSFSLPFSEELLPTVLRGFVTLHVVEGNLALGWYCA